MSNDAEAEAGASKIDPVVALAIKGDGLLSRHHSGVWTYPGAPIDPAASNLILPLEYVTEAQIRAALAGDAFVVVSLNILNEPLAVRMLKKNEAAPRVLSGVLAGSPEAGTEIPDDYRPTHDAGSTSVTPAEAEMLALRSLEATLYEAASASRRTQGWRSVNTDANAETRVANARLRDVSRDMVRNNPFAARTKSVIANNVVGAGIIPAVRAKRQARADTIKELIDQHLDTTDIDADGRLNLYGLQWLAMATIVEAGEVLIRRRIRRTEDGYALPFQIQVLEPDYSRPHTIGKKVILFLRRWNGGTQFDLYTHLATVTNACVVAFNAGSKVIDLGDGSRTYLYKTVIRGSLIDMIWTRSRFADTERIGIYFATFNTVAGRFTNLAGTVEVSTIDLTSANASFRLFDTADNLVTGMDFAMDAVIPDKRHLIWFDPAFRR